MKHEKLDAPTMLPGSVNDRSPPNDKISLSVRFFEAAKTFTHAVLRAVLQGKLVTRQCAVMSGCRGSAKNLALSARIVSIARFFPSRTT